MAGTATIVAHQGGWDEILLVVGPIVVIIGILALVKRRVEANLGDDPSSHDAHDGHEGAGTPPHADGDISSR